MSIRLTIIIFTCFTLFSACKKRGEAALFQELSPEQTGIQFKNQLIYNDSLTVLEFEYMFNGGGVALCDVNNDGLQDIFFTGNMTSCKLYLNKGNLKFEDITEKAGLHTEGWSYGASIVDINQDGFQDIYISKAGSRKTPPNEMKNQFFINNGNNTFTDKAGGMGLDENGYDIQAAFLDYDKDGDLDMYLTKNAFVNYNRNNIRPKLTEGQAASTDKLFKNEGNTEGGKLPHFTDVSAQAGITIEGFGLGVNVCDLNGDNYPDIYVSNDFLTNDLVWINNKNGTFTNKAHDMLRHTTYNGMGNDVADYNNDGLPDIAVVDMLPPDVKRWKLTMGGNTFDEFQQSTFTYGYEPQYVRNTLQLNNGNGTFSEIGQLAGIHATEWSWSPLFADYDNDGKKDLFIANGYRQDVTNLDFIMYGKRTLFMGTPEANRKDRLDMLKKFEGIHIHNYLYCNKGDLTFEDVSEKWGMTKPSYSNGAVYGDLDNDGDLDLVINNLDEVSQVYENKTNTLKPDNKWLRLKLKGEQGNRDGLGAQVWLWQKGEVQYQYFSPYRGYLSTMEHFVHFGLQNAPVDSLKILWANGKTQTLNTPSVNQVLTLDINNTTKKQLGVETLQCNVSTVQFTDVTTASGINYKHQEDEFVDFKIQPILPRLYSHDGPCLAVADINGDGLEDFYVGAAAGFKGSFFIQMAHSDKIGNKNGSFISQPMLETNASDDMSALFFDADKDGDMDLYIASGGVLPQKQGDPVYQHRLFMNDGKGHFTKNSQAIPPSVCTSASIVTACDYDKDGDLDLFVGGRISAGEYPMPPRSFLLKNTNGIFTDETPESLKNIGMVTAANWADIDGDKWQDLVLVGEFMPITIFKNKNGTLRNPKSEIRNSRGWWNSITAADFDKDGDIDFVVGNLGLNTPYRPTPKEPVCIYAKDYDKNGRIDPIMCRYENGKEYMTHARDDINKQITPMRARFRDYTTYAITPFEKAFRPDEISDAYVVRCEKTESMYLENKGNGQFDMHNLPIEAQFSPINSMITGDFDKDGNLDVLAVGNSYSTEVQTGRYDAQGSLLLKGNGKGNFIADRHALNVIGDNRAVVSLKKADGSNLILIAPNSDNLKAFKIN
jgi:enediyne biosynthesis protein E4